ncbi:MAG: CRISPR system precrRNA processing endoribonuclease RAMP protein Cas6 [Phormidesmis sp.]
MPQSLVLNLVAQSDISRQHLQGHALQQLFFNLIDIVDPELSHVLRRDRQTRAYSLSAMQVDTCADLSPGTTAVPAGNVRLFTARSQDHLANLQYMHSDAIAPQTRCWWRISLLDDELFDHLIFLWNQLTGETFELGSGTVKLTGIAADLPGLDGLRLDWASSCSYRDIYEQASAHERDIHIQFITPTAFENQGHLTPLPTADAVFQPLRKRWNRFGGLAFAPSLIANIIPTHFNIQTELVQSARRQSIQAIVGCTGQISFRIDGSGDPLTIKRINTLADFTRYCPVGCNTPLGMGVVRRLSNSPELGHSPIMPTSYQPATRRRSMPRPVQ